MYLSSELVTMTSALLVALILDVLLRLIPQLRDWIAPFMGIPARFFMRIEKKLNRSERPFAVRRIRGYIALLLLFFIAFLFAVGVYGLLRFYPQLEPIVWFVALRITHPWTVTYEALSLLKEKKLNAIQALFERRGVLISSLSDYHASIRKLLEEIAISFVYGFWVPVFYGIVAAILHYPSAPIIIMIGFFNEAYRVVTVKNIQEQIFVKPFIVIHHIITFIPSRIAALFLVLGTLFTPRAKPIAAMKGIYTQGHHHRDPSAGWVIAVMAHALNVSLSANKKDTLWIGSHTSSARAEVQHLQSGLWLHAVTFMCIFLALITIVFLGLAT